jgi:hypothetical protein
MFLQKGETELMNRSAYLIVATLIASLASIVNADARPFTFVYDTYPVGKGSWEFEQWVTYSTHTDDEPGFDRVDFREEIEFGLADNFDLAFYLPSWRYEDSEERTGTKFDSVDVEGIFYLSSPRTDPLGVALYMEVGVGEHEMKFEPKLLVQKDIDNWIIAYNFVAETEIEGVGDDEEENEVEGEIEHLLGISYSIDDKWFVGGEVIVASEFEDWEEYENTTVYAGPVVSYQGAEHWWITVTPTVLLTQEDEGEADFQVRMIAGLSF